MFKNKSILITGGTGMIGSHLVELLSKTSKVRITSHKRDIPYEINPKKVEILHGDLTDKEFSDKAVKGIDYVFHLAARVYGIMGNLTHKTQSIHDNLLINTNVVEASRVNNVKKIMKNSYKYSERKSYALNDEIIKQNRFTLAYLLFKRRKTSK